MEKKKIERMKYWHMCECGREFEGFEYQNTCWICMKYYIRWKFKK